MKSTLNAHFDVTVWYRESTLEWVGEIEYTLLHDSESGTIRVTSPNEYAAYQSAINALAKFAKR